MKLKNVLVYTGYVESGSWSAIPFQHRTGFDSVEEMLQHLGQCILTGYKLEEKYTYFPKCCLETMEEAKQKFCGKCGRNVVRRAIDREKLAHKVLDIRTGDNNSICQEIWEILKSNDWSMWGWWNDGNETNDFTNVVVLGDHGEFTLADAAFGRIFDVGPSNEDSMDYDPEENWKKTPEEERRQRCKDRYKISVPKGAKLFLDE